MKCPVSDLELPDDGRPCNTDVFLAAAIEQHDDKWDFHDAVKDWIHGDWKNALVGITIKGVTE
jgi:hypothetical protein